MREARLAFVLAGGILLLLMGGCAGSEPAIASDGPRPSGPQEQGGAIATFAGGCFWCMEAPFEKLAGVREVLSGFTGGNKVDPTYDEVSAGSTGHAEAVRIRFDPQHISYEELLDVFWRQIDPTDGGGQFADRGTQYRTTIFYHDEEQRRLAEQSKAALARSGRFEKPLVTPIEPARAFYAAEDYHQDFFKKDPQRYEGYRRGSGRAAFLERVWGAEANQPSGGKKQGAFSKPSEVELLQKLTPLQYRVTQQAGTEPPFHNEYWDNHGAGIYVDVVSGEPLFSSKDKFDSGTGWPSFKRPLEAGNVIEHDDSSLGVQGTEVRSRHANSHLGHIFPDGPPPTGLRYCINSAALRFIPVQDLEREGYADYRGLFD